MSSTRTTDQTTATRLATEALDRAADAAMGAVDDPRLRAEARAFAVLGLDLLSEDSE
jgi:hypothetical protein